MARTARDVVFVDGVRTPFGKAGPNGLFAVPVEVPAEASPGDRLVSYLGRHPGAVA